jgi:hypothetical protein
MTAEKKSEQAARSSVPAPAPGSQKARKAWVPKSPVEVVLDQIRKQEKRVAEMQQALDLEKTSLNKLLQAKKVLES